MAIYKDGVLIATKTLVDDNLVSDKKSRALSARQGKALKEMIDNKVEKVDGKGLSANDYTKEEKDKVGVLITDDLEGKKFLANDGTYKEVGSGGGDGTSIDDTKLDSTTTTLSASKIVEVVDGKIDNTDVDLLSTDTTISSAKIKELLGKKVDKVDGKGLSTNDYIKTDKDKVGKIITDGDGNGVLTNDGSYKSIGELSVIDDNVSSLEKTYSSKKVDDLLNTKVKLSYTQKEYDDAVSNSHTHTNKDVLDDITLEVFGGIQNVIETIKTEGDGKGFLTDNGTYVPIEGIESQIDDTDLESTTTTLSASKINTVVDDKIKNKVDKVDNKGLSTHDYNDLDQGKVSKLITTGDGKSFLSNDGSYKEIDLNINDEVISPDGLYSSEKIENILTEVKNSIEASSEGTAFMWQKTFLNVQAGDVLRVNTTDDYTMNKVIVQPYKFIEGEQNIVETIKTFDNSDASNFYYNPENVEFNGAMRIRDRYPLNFTYNATEGYYESEVINKDDFVDLYGIEVI